MVNPISSTPAAVISLPPANTGNSAVAVPVGDIYKALRDKFVEAASNLTVGCGLEQGVQVGPLVSEAHKQRVLDYIEKGVAEGAELRLKTPARVIDHRSFDDPSIMDGV